MNKEQLFESMQGIDDAILTRSERPVQKKPHPAWVRWVAAAACLCLVLVGAAAIPGALRQPERIAPGSETAPDGQGSDVSEPVYDVPSAAPEIYYNQVNTASTQDAAALFGEALTEEELKLAAPAVTLDWMDISGTAQYYGWGELACVALSIKNAAWDGTISVTLRDAAAPVYSDVILEPQTTTPTQLGEFEFTAYQYTDSNGALIWAEFERGDVAYTVSANVDLADMEQAKSDLSDVLACYAETETIPNLDGFQQKGDYEWLNETLSLADARDDQSFGAYLPTTPPGGFSDEVIRRYQGPDNDYLSGLWRKGYDSLSWTVSYLDDQAAQRIASVDEPEQYDLSLYPIPMADSVPEELREIVEDPIFRIEELTLATVYARAYTVSDAGDTGGYRMAFSVLYGDVVVKVNAKGVSPEWVYEQLSNLN